MDTRHFVSSLTSRFDGFLYAPICVEANGMQLSVLSALARMNIDPWQEANRLARMPKETAEKALVGMLDMVSGKNLTASEAQAIATRLVRLLPKVSEAGTAPPTGAALASAQPLNFWIVWLGFALAISFLSPHHRTAKTSVSTSPSVTESSSGNNAKSTLSGDIDPLHR